MTQRLQQQGNSAEPKLRDRVIQVNIGTEFSHNNDIYTIDPGDLTHYERLMQAVLSVDRSPIITHLWTLGADRSFEETQTLGFYSLLYLAQAIGQQNTTDAIHIGIATSNTQDVIGTEAIHPETATLLGACRVIPQEYANITCCTIDLVIPDVGITDGGRSIDYIISEILAQSVSPIDSIVA